MGTRVRSASRPRWIAALLIALGIASAISHVAGSTASGRTELKRAKNLPPIVYVERARAATEQIPGVGPLGRTMGVGGRLMLRDPKGRVRDLLPKDALYDVS